MTSIHCGAVPYTPREELNREKCKLLHLRRVALYEFVFSAEACEAVQNEGEFRKILNITLHDCQIDLAYLADFLGVRFSTVKVWERLGPRLEVSRKIFILDIGRILWREIDAYNHGRISPQWLFRAENDNEILLVRTV